MCICACAIENTTEESIFIDIVLYLWYIIIGHLQGKSDLISKQDRQLLLDKCSGNGDTRLIADIAKMVSLSKLWNLGLNGGPKCTCVSAMRAFVMLTVWIRPYVLTFFIPIIYGCCLWCFRHLGFTAGSCIYFRLGLEH